MKSAAIARLWRRVADELWTRPGQNFAALDGLRLTALSADDGETDWLRPAVRRQLRALLG